MRNYESMEPDHEHKYRLAFFTIAGEGYLPGTDTLYSRPGSYTFYCVTCLKIEKREA